ncbi:MATE efflux family protein [Sodalis praecaptivus]|uniref:MATE efflux family protein n=1 Tax=Sodalis praecaptivus TaxID=1239307 RepID=W0HSN6_9GAMM|nr:MATE family efflux transporter [Sodalis praecaptivus]AHF75158.1 MATE efflux family protein [Sodalis praecaptivus]
MAIANIKYRYQQVALSAVPFILLMLSQSLNSLIDMFIVGRISVSAVAAVGLCGFIFSLFTSAVTGIMISVQTLVARSLGAGRERQAIDALHSACVVALLVGAAIMLAIPLVPGGIRLVVTDGELAENCVIYLQTLMCATPAIGCVRAFRGYFGGLGENRFSLLIIVGIYLCNFIIGYSLVSAGLGIRGAGLGTVAAWYLGTLLFFLSGRLLDAQYRFYTLGSLTAQLKPIVSLSWYAGVQQLFFSGGFAVMFIIASRMGTAPLAIITVLNNLMLFSVMPLIGIGMASAAFISKSLGAGQRREAGRWGNAALLVGITLFAAQLLLLSNPITVMSFFLHDATLLDGQTGLLRATVACVFFEVFAQILKFSLFGAGYNRQIARLTIPLQWGVFVPSAGYLCLLQHGAIETLWSCFLAYRFIEALCISVMWWREKWAIPCP